MSNNKKSRKDNTSPEIKKKKREKNTKIKKVKTRITVVTKSEKHKKKPQKRASSKTKWKRVPKKKRVLHRKKWHKKVKRLMNEFLISCILFGVLIYIISLFTFTFTKIEGYSMLPTVSNGEHVFVSKLSSLKRFKLVLYKDKSSNQSAVRRIIGLPGERIKYQDDVLYVNDKAVYERFLADELDRAKITKTNYTENWIMDGVIPEGKYIILGDNRSYAADSREYGCVDESELFGVVEMRIIPIDRLRQF